MHVIHQDSFCSLGIIASYNLQRLFTVLSSCTASNIHFNSLQFSLFFCTQYSVTQFNSMALHISTITEQDLLCSYNKVHLDTREDQVTYPVHGSLIAQYFSDIPGFQPYLLCHSWFWKLLLQFNNKTKNEEIYILTNKPTYLFSLQHYTNKLPSCLLHSSTENKSKNSPFHSSSLNIILITN